MHCFSVSTASTFHDSESTAQATIQLNTYANNSNALDCARACCDQCIDQMGKGKKINGNAQVRQIVD